MYQLLEQKYVSMSNKYDTKSLFHSIFFNQSFAAGLMHDVLQGLGAGGGWGWGWMGGLCDDGSCSLHFLYPPPPPPPFVPFRSSSLQITLLFACSICFSQVSPSVAHNAIAPCFFCFVFFSLFVFMVCVPMLLLLCCSLVLSLRWSPTHFISFFPLCVLFASLFSVYQDYRRPFPIIYFIHRHAGTVLFFCCFSSPVSQI